MKTSNSFSISLMTDTDLTNLFNACASEMAKREEQRAARRIKWIEDYYWSFVNHPNGVAHHVGEVTVVAVYDRRCGQRIATARPIHGDKFDHDTGIAVAYAKAIGDCVPDYI